jgi:rubrerythrin
MAVSQEALASLNVDLGKEHGAIIQYLLHMSQVRDTVLRASILEAAREEMWHMEWLTEAIRDRGGTATLDRAEEIVVAGEVSRNLLADVDAESGALAHYERTLAAVGDADEELSTLVRRIMDDERHHRTAFGRMADLVGADGEDAFRPAPALDPADAQTAAPMIGLEYEGILQYLQNKYGSHDKEESETYFELGINEMRHLYWVATCYGGLGTPQVPPNPKDRVTRIASSEGAHQRAEEYEGKARTIIEQVRKPLSGESISEEMQRIDFQHDYHRYVLAHMERPAKTN